MADDANFCTMCGKVNEDIEEVQIPSYEAAKATPTHPSVLDEYNKAKAELSTKILTFSILGLSFALTFYLAVLGLIFSIIAKKLVKEHVAKFGETSGKASVGKGINIGGLVLSIVMTVFLGLYTIAMIAVLLSPEDSGIYFDHYGQYRF